MKEVKYIAIDNTICDTLEECISINEAYRQG